MYIKTHKNKANFNLIIIAAFSVLSLSSKCYAETNSNLSAGGDLFIAGAATSVGIAIATSHSHPAKSFTPTPINPPTTTPEPCNPQPTVQCNSTCINDLQNILDNFRIQNNIPGMQMTISTGSQAMQTFCSGTTTLHGTTNVGKNSLFEIGSITKSYISAVILQLEAEGKLSLDDKVGKWFPQYSDWSNVTIKQLLNMTAGIYDYADDEQFVQQLTENHQRYWSMTEITNFAYSHNPNSLFLPGQGWSYSNTQYTLIGMIIEMVTHKSVEENLRERIFIPLGLHNTIYQNDLIPSNLTLMVHGYWEDSDTTLFAKDQDLTDINISWGNSAGAIISPSEDVAKWIRALFSGQILKSQQFREMTTLVCSEISNGTCTPGSELPVDTDQGGYSLGLVKLPAYQNPFGQNVWCYAGSTMSYNSRFIYSMERNFIIAVTTDISDSTDAADAINLMQEVKQYLYPNGLERLTKILKFSQHAKNN